MSPGFFYSSLIHHNDESQVSVPSHRFFKGPTGTSPVETTFSMLYLTKSPGTSLKSHTKPVNGPEQPDFETRVRDDYWCDQTSKVKDGCCLEGRLFNKIHLCGKRRRRVSIYVHS